MISKFMQRLWEKYMARKGYTWNGYTAPELIPQVKSDSVLALAEIVEELERRVEILEGIRKMEQEMSRAAIASLGRPK